MVRLLAILLVLGALAAVPPASGAGARADSTAIAPAGSDPVTSTTDDLARLAGREVVEVVLTGLRDTRPEVVRHRLTTAAGGPLDPTRLHDDRLALLATGAFTEVHVVVAPVPDGVTVTFALSEGPTYRLSPSLMINAEGGLSVGGGLATANAEGLLVSGRLGLLFGGVQQADLAVDIPRVAGRYGRYRLVYFNRQRENELLDFFEVASEVEVTAAPSLGGGWSAGVHLGYRRVRADRDGRTLAPDRVDDVNILGAVIMYDRRDNPLLTRQGSWCELLVTRRGLLGGESDFWRLTLDARTWQPLGGRLGLVAFGLARATRGDLGEDVAPWQQFHVGGASTVRGWPVGALSGTSEAIATLELRATVRELGRLALPLLGDREVAVQLALFADAGLAWNGPADARLDRKLVGRGLGLHLIDRGVGRLRLDLSWGGEALAVRLHVGAGEKPEGQRRRVR